MFRNIVRFMLCLTLLLFMLNGAVKSYLRYQRKGKTKYLVVAIIKTLIVVIFTLALSMILVWGAHYD